MEGLQASRYIFIFSTELQSFAYYTRNIVEKNIFKFFSILIYIYLYWTYKHLYLNDR